MEKIKALVTAEIIRPTLEGLCGDRVAFTYDGYTLNHDVMEHEKLRSIIGGYEILICEYDTISKDILEAATNLKIIICCRGGVKSVVDLEEAERRGIIVCNNSGRNAGAVADLVLGYMIDLTRHITLSNNSIHNRLITQDTSTKPKEYQDTVWGLNNESPFIRFRGRSLNQMTLGIFGFGCVGRLVAQRAHAFGMRIITCHPFTPKKQLPEYVEDVNWDEFLAQSDIISAHCLLTPKSRDMFNKELFAKMKDGAYFINTARGGIVVEADMIEALKSGKLAGAAIDVTCVEPISSDSPLVGCPNLIITPHIAGSAHDVQVCGTRMVCESLLDFLRGIYPAHRVV